MKPYCVVNGLCKIFICLTTVDFPDSPAPLKRLIKVKEINIQIKQTQKK
jgi:hypothetical protein